MEGGIRKRLSYSNESEPGQAMGTSHEVHHEGENRWFSQDDTPGDAVWKVSNRSVCPRSAAVQGVVDDVGGFLQWKIRAI